MENFRKELEILINKYSGEQGSNTPDFILADYLQECLMAFDKAVRTREEWYGRTKEVQSNWNSEDYRKWRENLDAAGMKKINRNE